MSGNSEVSLTEMEWRLGMRDVRNLVSDWRDEGKRTTLYFARVGDAVKVGHARDVEARLRLLRVDNAGEVEVLATVRGTTDGEARVHERFDHLRIRGEWFVAAPELLNFATFCYLVDVERGVIAELDAAEEALSA